MPIRLTDTRACRDIAGYLATLPASDIIVVDGSEEALFARIERELQGTARHLRPDPAMRGANGKVRNVLTGLQHARHSRIVVADDDVRYDTAALARIATLLDMYAVVRPQNYFDPLPWHALVDTARTLLNRALDGDWPGTLAFRREALPRGYNADVLFENLELVRTVRAAGGSECVARDLYVRRLPPTTAHFWSQRVRQAYDEFARPTRLIISLALLPVTIVACARGLWSVPVGIAAAAIAIAAYGRARDGGPRYFPAVAVLAAPLWVAERAICAWLALYERLRYGGVRYANGVIRHAATPQKELARQWAG